VGLATLGTWFITARTLVHQQGKALRHPHVISLRRDQDNLVAIAAAGAVPSWIAAARDESSAAIFELKWRLPLRVCTAAALTGQPSQD
jgi:hypothetical protein